MDAKRNNVGLRERSKPAQRLIIERTVTGSSHGNKANIIPLLELTKVDHHFVPTKAGSDEDLQIEYKIRGFDTEEVKLRISNETHTPKVVYERPLTTEERRAGENKIIKWNGAANCASGPLKGKLINPMFGAYKVELVSRRKTSPALPTHVIFRDLKIEQMNWADVFTAITTLPAAKFPTTGSGLQQWVWVQYKLNELGYHAGPLTDKIDLHMALRAIFRYTQEHPDFPTIYEFKTLDAGDPGKSKWGWLSEWSKAFSPIRQIFQQPLKTNVAKLIDKLEKNDRPYKPILEDADVFKSSKSQSKVFVDHNIFFQNKDYDGPDAHADYDAEFCNRPSLPLKAKALLLSRTDEDASKPGIDSPEAAGEFECEWKAFDPPEDISVVPIPPPAKLRLATKARAYIDTVHRKVDGDFGDELNPQDNCPLEYGGVRTDDPTDVRNLFSSLNPIYPSRIEGGKRFFSKANLDLTSPAGIIGTNGATFVGSYIAGDNYIIQARLAFEKLPNARELLTIHYGIENLKPALKLKGLLKKDEPKSLVAQSGSLTVWRRTAVAHVFDWGPSDYPPIEWFRIIDAFRAAHIELSIPKQGAQRLDAVIDQTAKNEIVAAIVKDTLVKVEEPNKTLITNRQAQKMFSGDGFYPVPLPTLLEYESTLTEKLKDKKARFVRYTNYLVDLVRSYPTYSHMVGAAYAIKKAIDRLRPEPGAVIVRTAYLPKPNWNALLPADIANATRKEQAAFFADRGISGGMDYGVVMLDSSQYPKFSDEFFFSHEISHCLFGTHPPQFPDDHDSKDSNCIMNYAKDISGIALGWGARKAPASEYTFIITMDSFSDKPTWDKGDFKGQFISGVKSRGNVSGKFKSTSSREWSITGSLETVQKALNEFKFEPKLVFTDKSKTKPNDIYTSMKLSAPALEPKFSEELMPLKRIIEEKNGASKPFADVTIEPFSLKNVEPRFCGKCVLKFRGWRVRAIVNPTNNPTPPDPLPKESIAYPTNPRMEFTGYKIQAGKYFAQIGSKQDFVDLDIGKTDPQDPTVKLGPLRFLHEHKLSWESTDGKLSSLKGVLTREYVKFRTPTQAAPFSVGADPDQEFYMGEADASEGEGFDDHSMRWPALICTYPLAAGTLIGEQWYQYKMPGGAWENFPEAAFLVEKTVYQNGSNWVLKFKKTNWEPHNSNPFCFEVHYLIGKELKSKPLPMKLSYSPTPTKPYYDSGGGIIMAAGTHQIGISKDKMRETTLQELEQLGFLAPKPWL